MGWIGLRACLLVTLLGINGAASAALVQAIEYYHAGFDHYFVTASADEIGKLDGGFFTGWQRTGESFTVADPGTSLAGATPVCRFYGNPQVGLDSHFYSASPAECAAVQANFPNAWLLESSNVFQVYLPDTTTGACRAGSVPIYRSWNGRTDSNHRYTTSLATAQAMLARGYVGEGYGSPSMPVAMCSPTTIAVAVPQCTLIASSTSPVIGTTISLTANCSGSPSQFAWSGCASNSASCTVRSDVSGTVIYGVTASNGSGAGPMATVGVGWREPPAALPPPVCTLTVTTQGAVPLVGSTAVFTATCTNNPTSYAWSGCSSNGNSCYAAESAAGTYGYGLAASNQSGTGPASSLALTWAASAPPAPDFCGSFPNVLYSIVPWANTTLYSVAYPDPSFTWDGVWVTRITVPANATATRNGSVTAVEYGGGPTGRQMTISRAACDFRPADPSGVNGPLANISQGNSASASLGLANSGTSGLPLQPGQTYYINVRNAWPDGSISCPQATGSCGASVGITLPR
ncbi:MAG: hypothetical protein ABI920_09885 [Casimicrobiaceae bacterium]